jgi:hypothetical protein
VTIERRIAPGVLYGDDALAHLRRKLDAGEIALPFAERMLAALRAAPHNPPMSYDEARWHAAHPPLPTVVYHTAPRSARESIQREGLRVSQPGEGGSWAPNKAICRMLQSEQPPGVYVCREPDYLGVWAHWPRWDVWQISVVGLSYEHDALNPECWRLTTAVASERLLLVSS